MTVAIFVRPSLPGIPPTVRGSLAKRRAVYRAAVSSGARRLGRCNRSLAGETLQLEIICDNFDVLINVKAVRFVLRRANADLKRWITGIRRVEEN